MITVYPADRNQFEMEAGEGPQPAAQDDAAAPTKDRDSDGR